MDKNTQVNWPGYEVIEVENTLMTKAMVPGNPADAIAKATKRADTAVEQLSVQFPQWMKGESNRLQEIRLELADKGVNEERLDRLFTCSHDIKGQAQTFGYPYAALIARLLCDLIEHAPDPSRIPLAVLDQHVDTIRVIVRQDIKDGGNTQIDNIIQGLNVLDHSTLKKISANSEAAG